ncbi:uncharacterized protein F4822DRAFT_426449 [Hypoxylon trugodes]|uniref:uncharacterized protein n=1 Tax=Hypoxylon trugodes TaxID=326681 RepID=UPI0021935F77|nr:uncharacterized protein F4822DRAFT_426449 [Hypoxylon trugodes]KAI1390601.1 hypothetical protein F4822DRAFT_426449 [Hypoxylon trugodes]
MPSVKNPNGPSKNRLAARAAKARKQNQKRNAGAALERKSRVAKADAKRGARAGILPTSGPNAALSAKKRRKLERKMGHAVKRQMEAEGEVEMKDVAEEKTAETNKTADEDMAIDNDDIS